MKKDNRRIPVENSRRKMNRQMKTILKNSILVKKREVKTLKRKINEAIAYRILSFLKDGVRIKLV